MNFITHAIIAIVTILIGGLVSGAASFDPAAPLFLTRLSFGIAALLAQIELFLAALYLRSKSAPRFDMTVAAETLVALGVFSLIVGLVLAAIAMPNLNMTAGSVTLADFKPLIISFAEGLFASALAPVLATLLRQIEVLKYAPHSEGGATGLHLERLKSSADSVARALAQLRREAEEATKHTSSFAKAAGAMLGGLNEIAANIKEAKGIVPTALSSISVEIGNAGPGVTAAFNAAAGNVRAGSGQVSAAFESAADNIGAGGGLASKALAATGSSLGTFTTGVASSTETIRKMTDELDRLGKDAHAATGLLTRLQELIESVTNFIRTDKS